MSKFKVGDKVLVVAPDSVSTRLGTVKDEEYVVSYVSRDYKSVLVEGHFSILYNHEIELKEIVESPLFKALNEKV